MSHPSITIPVSLVIPVRNESATLHELFLGLLALSPLPAEVVFVDTGSTDSSVAEVESWMAQARQLGIRCHLCRHPGAYPGMARNVGVAAAAEEWIAFIDAGIMPQSDWLAELWKYRSDHQVEAVFGVCRFDSDELLGRMLCAASYGYGRVVPVLPASLFHKGLFEKVGYFQEQLRSGEDLLWKKALLDAGIDLPVCDRAIVSYRHFPATLSQAMRKWFIYEQSATVAGIGNPLRTFVLLAVLAMYPALAIAFPIAGPVFVIYLVVRGVADPLRRSNGRAWWSTGWQVLAQPLLVALLDVSSALGRVSALIGASRFRLGASSGRRPER